MQQKYTILRYWKATGMQTYERNLFSVDIFKFTCDQTLLHIFLNDHFRKWLFGLPNAFLRKPFFGFVWKQSAKQASLFLEKRRVFCAFDALVCWRREECSSAIFFSFFFAKYVAVYCNLLRRLCCCLSGYYQMYCTEKKLNCSLYNFYIKYEGLGLYD